MPKDIEIRVLVTQKHSRDEFELLLGTPRRLRTYGVLYDIDSFDCEENTYDDDYWPLDEGDM